MAPQTPLAQQNFQKLLEPGLRAIFHTELDTQPELYQRTKIFNEIDSQRAFEEHLQMGSLGQDGWDYKKTGTVQYDGFEQGFNPMFRHRPYAKGIVIERELLDDNLYPGAALPRSITERPERLARATELFRELIAADMFNGGFTDTGTAVGGFSYTGVDGVGMLSTSHPTMPGSSTVQSNEGVLPLTKANVTATRLAMRSWTDDRGQLQVVMGEHLLVPPELEEDAEVIVGSPMDPTSANNAINATGRRVKKITSWDYLTNPTSWYLMDERLRMESAIWYNRILPEFASAADFDTIMAKFRSYFRCSRGWTDWRFVFGQKPN